MSDPRYQNFARILVDYSAAVKPGERVAITAAVEAIPVVRELFALILQRGAQPHLLLDIPDQEELYYANAGDDLLDVVPTFHKIAFEEFEVLFKIRSETNTRALTNVSPDRLARRQKGLSALLRAQMQRGADRSLRWVATLFPTRAYAMEAGMGYEEYQDFFYRACKADTATADPVAEWQAVKARQQTYIDRIQGHNQVELRGPNVDLKLSIKDRKFVNACGLVNLPDGEIYTGPVETSAEGWVHYTYPSVYQGQVVSGIELTFKAGQVVKATAERNQSLLQRILDSDPGARYLGEFAIGANFQIDRFTHNILLDEKIGGSFHMAVGAGYPETGSLNKSAVHWDMICDLRQDSEILVDGETIYRNGAFL